MLDNFYNWNFKMLQESNLNSLKAAFDSQVDADYIQQFQTCYDQIEKIYKKN